MMENILSQILNCTEEEVKYIIENFKREQFTEFDILVNFDRGLGNEYTKLDDVIIAKTFDEAKVLAIDKVKNYFNKKIKVKEIKVKPKIK